MWLRDRSGSEPVTARSALGVRRVLSIIALVLAVVAAVFFVVQAMNTREQVWIWEAVIAAVVAVVAAVDLLVLRHRRAAGAAEGRRRR